ncbi:MAG: metallophosphoesterase [Clostridiaceae bacterium]|nr:metallophosphoesterase [Clostridiales bacterium]MDD6877427.1 metallophosphoesterase [Clostridiaceae bacterium]MDY3285440.1 metallophosphoesterase [Eubacteriales bacterium]MDY5016196.1 metallophosphoesterase [Eubacteriales bacterium]
MALYALADLHLSTRVNKPMDVFGGAWRGYMDKLRRNLTVLKPGDTLVVPGDLSWGISLEEALDDFRFLASYPGRKLLVKGNHDLWWDTRAKMERFLAANGVEGIEFLHNNCFFYDAPDTKVALCGTRGWFYEEDHGTAHDDKMRAREVIRLRASLNAAKNAGAGRIYCFMHYPPVYGPYVCEGIAAALEEYGTDTCFYGHLHGESCKSAFRSVKNGVNYRLVSCDSVDFQPILIEP